MAAERISEAAAHGFSSAGDRGARRRARARKAGLASGRARRRLCDPQARRVKQRELALNFRVRIIGRDEFWKLDEARRSRAGLQPNERGTETLWQEYRSCVRTFKVKGQGFLTTNGQRSEALAKAGRPRCERTIRRAHAALREMGLLRRYHDRRRGARAGARDRLRVQFAPSYVPLPSAAAASGASRPEAAALPPGRAAGEGRPAVDARQRSRPTADRPGRGSPPGPGGRAECVNDSNEEAGLEPLRGRWAQLALDFEADRAAYAARGGSP